MHRLGDSWPSVRHLSANTNAGEVSGKLVLQQQVGPELAPAGVVQPGLNLHAVSGKVGQYRGLSPVTRFRNVWTEIFYLIPMASLIKPG